VYDPRREEAEHTRPTEERTFEGFSGDLVTLSDPASASAQAYHTLAASVRYVLTDAPSKVIALTSPNSGGGTTTVCANLGVVLARAEKSVLVVDCNLHRPAVHKVFGLRNLQGLEDVLAHERELREVQQEPLAGLRVVVAGLTPPYPTEVLGSGRFREFLRQASNESDYVLIDSPPMAMAPDSLVLAAQADGVLLVLDARTTRKETVRQAMRGLESIGANVLGTVMNNVEGAE